MFFNKDKYILKRFKSIDDIHSEYVKKESDIIKRREKIKIIVLDDEGFDMGRLKTLGYSDVSVRQRFENIKDFQNCNIVLCDIDGVGMNIDSKKQGLAIVDQLRGFYPNVVTAIYTGKELEKYEYTKKENVTVIRKNLQTSDLAKQLDELCEIFWNPVKTWEVLEKYFRTNKLPNKEIAIMEDIFVRAIIKKNADEKYILTREKRIDNDNFKNVIDTSLKLIKIMLMNL